MARGLTESPARRQSILTCDLPSPPTKNRKTRIHQLTSILLSRRMSHHNACQFIAFRPNNTCGQTGLTASVSVTTGRSPSDDSTERYAFPRGVGTDYSAGERHQLRNEELPPISKHMLGIQVETAAEYSFTLYMSRGS
jgi:hypothetical protein